MNMMIGMLKSLLPKIGDYRIKWERCAPPDENIIVIEIRDMGESSNYEGKLLGSGQITLPK